MNSIARTNVFHSHLVKLNSFITNQTIVSDLSTVELSFTLVMEKALCALLSEVCEVDLDEISDCSFDSLLAYVATAERSTWVSGVIKNALNDDDNWLCHWYEARNKCLSLSLKSNNQSPVDDSVELIQVKQLSTETHSSIPLWLEGFGELVSECRSFADYH